MDTILNKKPNSGINYFTNLDNQGVMFFDLSDPLIAALVEDILDVSEALQRKREDKGVRISLEQVKANLLKAQS
jgi:hypothetical protein